MVKVYQTQQFTVPAFAPLETLPIYAYIPHTFWCACCTVVSKTGAREQKVGLCPEAPSLTLQQPHTQAFHSNINTTSDQLWNREPGYTRLTNLVAHYISRFQVRSRITWLRQNIFPQWLTFSLFGCFWLQKATSCPYGHRGSSKCLITMMNHDSICMHVS